MVESRGIFVKRIEYTGHHQMEREIRVVTNLLSDAIKKDGKGDPLTNTLSSMICQNLIRPIFAMGSTNDNIIAYLVKDDIIVTHNESERKKLEQRFRKLRCTESHPLL